PVPEGRQVGLEAQSRPPRQDGREGLDLLESDGRVVLVDQPVARAKAAELELDRGPDGPGVRVEDEDRLHAWGERQVDRAADRLDRQVLGARRDRARLAQLVAGISVGRLDRRAAERVVELVEEGLLPGSTEVLGG